MELKIEYVDIDTIKPYEKNAKTHPREQIDQIKKSIQEFGNCDPIGVWHDEIVEGYGRYTALKELGITSVPIIRLDNLTDEQRKAYGLIHNQLTMNSPWDIDILDGELGDIEEIDMSEFGFNLDVTNELGKAEEDEHEIELPEEPKAKRGDVYKLGNHRLMCGDSTNADDIKCLLGGDKARLLFTSPPYSDMRNYEGGKDLSEDNLAQFIVEYKDYCDFECVNLGLQYKDHEVYPYWNKYIEIAKNGGLKLLAWNVWNKLTGGSIGMQKHIFPVIHEWIFVFGEKEEKTNRTWMKKQDANARLQGVKKDKRSVRQIDGSTRYTSRAIVNSKYKQMESVVSILAERGSIIAKHPATFPVALPSEYINALTHEDDIVIEPFGGSGTTLIACQQLGRQCRCMELEPKYVDVIIERWENYTGKKAEKIITAEK